MAVSVPNHPPTTLPSSKERNTLRRTMGELRRWCVYSGKSRISSRHYTELQWSRTLDR